MKHIKTRTKEITYFTVGHFDHKTINLLQKPGGIATLAYVCLRHNPAQRINIKEEKYLNDNRTEIMKF